MGLGVSVAKEGGGAGGGGGWGGGPLSRLSVCLLTAGI